MDRSILLSFPLRFAPRPSVNHIPQLRSFRKLHLAPPFLIDHPYLPRYLSLSASQIACKRKLALAHLEKCNLCPRLCGVNRFHETGYCLIPGSTVKVATIGPHFGEEPCLQGHRGSGSIFFSGCNLRCVFCQNYDIAHSNAQGQDLTPEQLAEWCVKLQEYGCHNINFVTPEHVVPQVVLAMLAARDMGLSLPVVYNTSSFDSEASLELLDGVVDIYLADFKVWSAERGKRLLKAGEYAVTARKSVRTMWEQVGDLAFTGDGLAKKGLLVRHLVMPGMEEEGGNIVRWLGQEVSRDVYVNVMEQYYPTAHVGKRKNRRDGNGAASEQSEEGKVRYQEINRAVTEHEVGSVRKAAEEAGLWRFCDPPRHDGFNL